MKKTAFALMALAICACTPKDEDMKLCKDNIDRIVAEMTIEEKCHLLMGAGQKSALDSAELVNLGACSELVEGCAGVTYPIPRLGIPSIVLADGPAGLRINPSRKDDSRSYYCTSFPVGSMLASCWDPELVYEAGVAMGEEIKDYGVDVILGPGMNIQRNPLCGRNFEYYSEDPLISGKTASGIVRGIQSEGVGACIKHFAANNSEINRLFCDSRVSIRALREIYLKGFEIAVRESNPWTLMTSYNYLNGRYTSEDKGLLEDVLRGDWDFGGMVMTDWGGGSDSAAQIIAGNDNIQSGSGPRFKALLQAAQDGSLPMEAIDACVKRILELIVKCPKFTGYEYSDKPDLQAHAQVSRRVAAEGAVLLKNEEGALPLAKGSTVALFGASSYKLLSTGIGSGDVHSEHVCNLPEGLAAAGFGIEAVMDKIYREHVDSEEERLAPINNPRPWYHWYELYEQLPEESLQRGLEASAENADAAIITIARRMGEGTDRHLENDFLLSEDELSTIKAVSEAFHAKGKKISVLLNAGGVVETASWKELADAILLVCFPGQEAGHVVADLVSGKVNPSGRLAQSFPISYADVPSRNFPALNLDTGKNDSFYHSSKTKLYEIPNVDYIDYIEDIFVGYRYYTSFNVPTSYPFGHGLSYSSFATHDCKAKLERNQLKLKAKVTNTGSVEGRETVQVYVGSPAEGAALRELKAFAKTPLLAAGESCELSMDVDISELASFDEAASAWIAPAGVYRIEFCSDSEHPFCSMDVTLKKEWRKSVNRALEPEGELFIDKYTKTY